MSRPVIMTDEMKKQAREDFNNILNGLKMSDGKLSYTRSFTYKDSKATVTLTHEAYRKIVALVMEFSDEVAWHSTVSQTSESKFLIEDILVYPQEVTGSTVVTDQEAYTKWLYSVDDEVFNKIRMQGHSHVNMGVTPSNVDDAHRQQILQQLESDMFYIFMIWNKALTVNTVIYDMQRNILYENKDIEIKLPVDDEMADFLTDAKKKVQKRKLKSVPVKRSKSTTYSHYQQNPLYDFYDLGGEFYC